MEMFIEFDLHYCLQININYLQFTQHDMVLDLGIRLVILLPTFLFFVGFIFKAIVENNFSKKLLKRFTKNRFMLKIFYDRLKDYSIEIAIDSLFILIANGLIIIFELRLNELGILSIIFGVIFSILLLISIYTDVDLETGFCGIFGLLGGEFFYFLFYDVGLPYINNHYYITTIIGVITGLVIYYLIYEIVYKNYMVFIKSILNEEKIINDEISKKEDRLEKEMDEIEKEMKNLDTEEINVMAWVENEEKKRKLSDIYIKRSELYKKTLELNKEVPNIRKILLESDEAYKYMED